MYSQDINNVKMYYYLKYIYWNITIWKCLELLHLLQRVLIKNCTMVFTITEVQML